MKIELSLPQPRSRFVVDESIELQVRLHNDGAAAVRVPDPFRNTAWQPTYVITGPAFPGGKRFSARSATSRDSRPAPDDVPLTMIELPPGASHEGELPLSQWCPIPAPGSYTLVAELELSAERTGGAALSVRSDPLALQLDALDARGVSVGVDVGKRPPGSLWLSFVQSGSEPPAIYDALVVEERPDLGELERHSLGHRRDLEAGAPEAVHVPWGHDDRMAAMTAWRAWLQHDRLHADDSPLGQPFALPLAPGTAVLPPTWHDPREALDVLLLGPAQPLGSARLGGQPLGGRQLQLARFTSHGPPTPPTGAVVWHSEPRRSIVSARLALGPASAGSPRRVITVETHGDDLVVACFVAEPGGSGSPTATITLPQIHAVPGLGLAVHVTPEGRTRVWLLADAKQEGWQVYLARVEFDAEGRAASDGAGPLEPLIALPSPLLEAAIELVLPASGPETLVWALRTDDRRVLWSREGRAPRWYKAPRPCTLATPMQLRPLSQATYLAVLEPGRAPALVTLEE